MEASSAPETANGRGKNTMIRKALANGHEEHPEAQLFQERREGMGRFAKGHGVYNGDTIYYKYTYIYTYNNMYIYIYYIRNVWKLWKMEIWIVVSCFGNLGIEVIKNLSALMGHRLASISCAPSSRAIWVSSSPRRWALSGIRLVLWWREVALEYGEEWTFL